MPHIPCQWPEDDVKRSGFLEEREGHERPDRLRAQDWKRQPRNFRFVIITSSMALITPHG